MPIDASDDHRNKSDGSFAVCSSIALATLPSLWPVFFVTSMFLVVSEGTGFKKPVPTQEYHRSMASGDLRGGLVTRKKRADSSGTNFAVDAPD